MRILTCPLTLTRAFIQCMFVIFFFAAVLAYSGPYTCSISENSRLFIACNTVCSLCATPFVHSRRCSRRCSHRHRHHHRHHHLLNHHNQRLVLSCLCLIWSLSSLVFSGLVLSCLVLSRLVLSSSFFPGGFPPCSSAMA